MGLFDIFSDENAQDAAAAQKAGLDAAYNQASGSLNSGLGTATNYYNTALSGYAPLSQTANQGATAYANAMGLNGASGNQAAMSQFQQGPGYQYQLGQGLNAIDRGAAARGTLSSGGTLAAEQQYGQNLANQGWQQNLSNLSGYNTMAPQIAGAQAGINTNLGNLNYSNANSLANMGWNQQTGIGNANANADLAKNTASANMWGALMGGANLLAGGMGFGGFGGGSANTGSGSTAMSPGQTGWSNFGTGGTSYPMFAAGGRPPVGRVSVVGEKGPELFVADRPGTIIPNNVARTMGDFGARKAKMKAAAKANGKRLGEAFSGKKAA